MEGKTLCFHFELVPAKPTHPDYIDGSDQDESQKLPPEVLCEKCALLKFHKTHSKTPISESLFKKTLLKKRLWHRGFPVNFATFLRTPFLQNTTYGTRNST